MHNWLRCLLHQGVIYALPFLFVVACSQKREVTKNDEIGYASLGNWVYGYVERNGEFPTKEFYLDIHNRYMREFFLSEGYSEEKIDRFFADSLGAEMDYLKIWPYLEDLGNLGRTQATMIIVSNYLMTHPSLQFINQDSCLIVVDSTLSLPNGSVASMSFYLPEILIKDSSYYYYGVRQSSIKTMGKAVLQVTDSIGKEDYIFDFCFGTQNHPINVDYDSPVELIDTLRYYFYRLCFINKGVDKDEKISVYNHISSFHRQQIDSILGMPSIFEYSSSSTKEHDFLQCKKTYRDLIRNAKTRLYRSNDTIYLNGNPVDETCRLSADSSVILLDLTHNNTYRDLCELMHFMEKATDSESIEQLKQKGFRWNFYFKTDDKLYKAFEK